MFLKHTKWKWLPLLIFFLKMFCIKWCEANRQLWLQAPCCQTFLPDVTLAWGKQSWNACSGLRPSALYYQLHQINTHPDPSVNWCRTSFLAPFQTMTSMYMKACCLSFFHGEFPLQTRLWSLRLGPIHALQLRVSDISSGLGRAAADTVSSPFPPHPWLGQSLVSSWASPHLVQLWSLWWLPPVSLALSGHCDTWGRMRPVCPTFCRTSCCIIYPKDCSEKNYIGPWSEWEVPTDEAVDLKLHWVCRNLKEAGFCLIFDGEVATRIVKSPLIQLVS